MTKRTDRLNKHRRSPVPGAKIKTREELLRKGSRFLLDTSQRILHSLPQETLSCDLDMLFDNGSAEVYVGNLKKATADGIAACEECIGERAFDGKNTVLFVMHLPPRLSDDPLSGVVEREEFNRRLQLALMRDSKTLNKLTRKYGVTDLFYEAFPMQPAEADPDFWGEADATFELLPANAETVAADRDIRVDVHVPNSIVSEETKLQDFVKRSFLRELMDVPAIKRLYNKHASRFVYGKLLVFVHPCDSVDDCCIPRPSLECSSSSGGSGGFTDSSPTSVA